MDKPKKVQYEISDEGFVVEEGSQAGYEAIRCPVCQEVILAAGASAGGMCEHVLFIWADIAGGFTYVDEKLSEIFDKREIEELNYDNIIEKFENKNIEYNLIILETTYGNAPEWNTVLFGFKGQDKNEKFSKS